MTPARAPNIHIFLIASFGRMNTIVHTKCRLSFLNAVLKCQK